MFVHITQAQKKKLKLLVETKVGGPDILKKVGRSKPYELEVSFRYVGIPWSGEHEYTVTVADVVKAIIGLLESKRAFEEVVIDVNEFYAHPNHGRVYEDKADTIGISSDIIRQAIAA